jgi:hypothetical protein
MFEVFSVIAEDAEPGENVVLYVGFSEDVVTLNV